MIFNELEYAERMLKEGFLQDKYLMELKLLAKYYNKIKGLITDDIKIKLKEFCKKYLPEYNEILHLELISKAVHCGVQKKNTLVIVPFIPIMKNELEEIKKLNNLNLERLSFIALILSKTNKYMPISNRRKKNKNIIKGYYVNNYLFKDLFNYAGVICNKKERDILIDQLCETKLFNLTIFCALEVNFVDDINKPEFIIEYFDDLILEYLKYIGHNIVYCENCGKSFIPSNNRHKFCKDCWKEKERDNNRRYAKEGMRKLRSNNVKGLENSNKPL